MSVECETSDVDDRAGDFCYCRVYVTQSLVSALSMQSLPALVALLAVRWRLPVRQPCLCCPGAEVYLGAVDRALAASAR